MNETGNVMVFIEADDDGIADVSLELICEAGKLAERLGVGVGVEGVALGNGRSAALAKLGEYGCQRVFYTEDARLTQFTAVPYAKIIAATIRRHQPRIVLYGATTTGRAVAPRVASELRCGLTADCTALDIGDCTIKGVDYSDSLLQIRPAFGGNIIATIVSPDSSPSMATVREGVMKIITPRGGVTAEIIAEPLELADDDFPTTVLETTRKRRAVDLKAARIIVAAGMGVADAEGLALCRQLADTLGGVLGASRAVVDAGLAVKDHQVGQTGTTVRPNLYIACGISGSIQHMAGMKESQRIIAVNSDPEAPIFKLAHYGIVGDLHEVLPKMIRAYKGQN
ncbi:MAG: electron transfer flavoprotein subunit alpha/FixB family protein [Planctomycetota bacterium]